MKVTCIIPAYNEGPRVGVVVRAVVGHPLVDEVIVINDCSTDNTLEVLKQEQGIHLINHEHNQGKTAAVLHGLEIARNDLILMLDADLVGLDEASITSLIAPVLEGKADMTLSIRSNSLDFYKWIGLDFVSGERVFHKSILGDLSGLRNLKGYGLEVYLNSIVLAKKLRLKIVYLAHVSLTFKAKKIGWWAGLKGEVGMVGQVVSTVGLVQIVKQLIQMRRLRV